MALQITVQRNDVTDVPSDLLVLKHAQGFYGADELVAFRLAQHGVCQEADISPAIGEQALVSANGAVAADRVLFLGTPRLREFRYKEMRLFARRAIEVIGEQRLPVRVLTTTVHGAGYGLDVEEALQAMIFGFQQGLAACPLPQLEQIIFVERNARRCELLQSLLSDVEIVSAPANHTAAPPKPSPEPAKKKCVFVAMPFAEEFEDVYQFGIYGTVRKCGYVCEKVDESVFAGSIVDRIIDGIQNASFVIADLTLEKPNVYLEVGYAWGMKKPVLLVAREGQRLHFDLSHHKCLFYKTIGKLAESLEASILELFGPGDDRG